MGGESCTVLRLSLMRKLAMCHIHYNLPNMRGASNTSKMTSMCGFKRPIQSYSKVVRQPQKPTQGDNNFVPGPKGAQRITGQASH